MIHEQKRRYPNLFWSRTGGEGRGTRERLGQFFSCNTDTHIVKAKEK